MVRFYQKSGFEVKGFLIEGCRIISLLVFRERLFFSKKKTLFLITSREKLDTLLVIITKTRSLFVLMSGSVQVMCFSGLQTTQQDHLTS